MPASPITAIPLVEQQQTEKQGTDYASAVYYVNWYVACVPRLDLRDNNLGTNREVSAVTTQILNLSREANTQSVGVSMAETINPKIFLHRRLGTRRVWGWGRGRCFWEAQRGQDRRREFDYDEFERARRA